MKRPIDVDDVVRITSGKCKNQTGVVLRVDTTMEPPVVCILRKGEAFIGTWFQLTDVKRITSLRGRPKQLEMAVE